jgi:hypothetical protein
MQQEDGFNTWVATIADEFRQKFDHDIHDFGHFRRFGNLVVARFDQTMLGGLGVGLALYHFQVLQNSGLGLDVWVDDERIDLIPPGYKNQEKK